MNLKNVILIVFPFLSSLYCRSYEKLPNICYKIEGVFGPEDFVFLEDKKIFLISSHNRRNPELPGEIFSYDLSSGSLRKVERLNEPDGISFRPHGIDFFNGHIYAILHGADLRTTSWHAVAVYEWDGNNLIFKKLMQNERLSSPNDIAVYSDGIFFITNDSKNRGSFWELFFTLSLGIKKGSVVACDINKDDCVYVQEDLGFPNGICVYKSQLFVSATLEDKIYRFDIKDDLSLSGKSSVAKVQGPDNLILFNNKLYVASHPSLWKFLRHSNSSDNISPSIGYEIDLESYDTKLIFSDEGSRISASSVILNVGGDLYIGQVFEPFLLRCETQ